MKTSPICNGAFDGNTQALRVYIQSNGDEKLPLNHFWDSWKLSHMNF